MASKTLVALLFSSLFTSISSFEKVENLPDTYCITYLSTYLVPVSGVNNGPASEPTSRLITQGNTFPDTTIQDATLGIPTQVVESSVLETFDPSVPSSLYNSLSLPIDEPTSTPTKEPPVFLTTSLPPDSETSTPEPGPGGRAVIFRVVPSSQDTKRTFYRRALGGYVGSQTDLCDDALVFNLFRGRLFEGNAPIYYDGESYKELRGQTESLPAGAITTTFDDDGGYVQFVSSSLPDGRAGFCQVPSSGQVYLTFGASPSNCVPVRLAVVGVEECLDEAPKSVEPVFTEPTSIGAPVTEDIPRTESFPTTSVRFANSSTIGVNFPVGPTRSSVLSFATIGTDEDIDLPTVPILPTSTVEGSSLTDVAPIDDPTTEPVFPPEETTVLISSGSEIEPILASETSTVGSELETSITVDTSVAGTETADTTDTETTTTEATTAPNTTTTGDSTTIGDTTTVEYTTTATGTTDTEITTLETTITTAPDTTTADTTTTEPTTTAAPAFQRACPREINGIDLFNNAEYFDDQTRQINVPFDVGLFGEFGRTIYVSDNGLVTINSAEGAWAYANTNMPVNYLPPLTIFSYWDDMDIDRSLGHQVTYEVADDPQEGPVVRIDWCVGSYPREGGYNHWTLSLYERNPGRVLIKYDSTAKKGSSATVGLQNRNRGMFKQFSINTVNSITDSTILDFRTFDDGRTDIYRYGF
ncbi:hypothetical protein FLONG3_6881 [Fusarium longipes]|uniref:DUF7908 domain-containing protein n=1 Tax=Fusarium longipes TaxID=694270 RepID=A0A395SIC5_9HYPO|nr:hypothetical protein FLONG3_6881 [Fusarium longipes]